jgi:hypothetical protein
MTNKWAYLFKTSSGLELNFLRSSCEFIFSRRGSSGLLAARLWPLTVEYVGVWDVVRNIVLLALRLVVEERPLVSHIVNSPVSHNGGRGSVPAQFM